MNQIGFRWQALLKAIYMIFSSATARRKEAEIWGKEEVGILLLPLAEANDNEKFFKKVYLTIVS